jgi:type IV secretory pathway component VirB8
MSTDRQEIAKKVRSGAYFKEANDWYAGKYLYPITERAMMALFAAAAIFALIPIVLLVKASAGIESKVPFPMIVADTYAHFATIKPLAKSDETAQEAVAKYIIIDYIKSREEYISSAANDSEKRKKLLKKIKSSSAKSVLNEYNNQVNENNPYSPINRYKDHTSRLIEIQSFTFLDNDQTSGKAKVIFTATETHISGNKKVSRWEALINFRLPDVATIAKTGAPLRFITGYYRTKQLESAKKNDTVQKVETQP